MKRAHWAALLAATLMMSVGVSASAQDDVDPNNRGPEETKKAADEDIYKGIIPGKRDTKEHINKSASRKRAATKVLWIGYLPQDTRTRIFVQTDGSSDYDTTRGADGTTFTITIPGAKLADRNLRRDIDASYHGRDVSYIKISDKRKEVKLTMTVKPGVDPRISTSGNYINIDFPHSPKSNDGG